MENNYQFELGELLGKIMTLEQLKQRVEATCNKNGIFPENIIVQDSLLKNELVVDIYFKKSSGMTLLKPNTDLLLEAVDLECRAIKARQSSATNGIDE